MQRLGKIDEVDDLSGKHLLVKFSYSADSHYRTPVGMLA